MTNIQNSTADNPVPVWIMRGSNNRGQGRATNDYASLSEATSSLTEAKLMSLSRDIFNDIVDALARYLFAAMQRTEANIVAAKEKWAEYALTINDDNPYDPDANVDLMTHGMKKFHTAVPQLGEDFHNVDNWYRLVPDKTYRTRTFLPIYSTDPKHIGVFNNEARNYVSLGDPWTNGQLANGVRPLDILRGLLVGRKARNLLTRFAADGALKYSFQGIKTDGRSVSIVLKRVAVSRISAYDRGEDNVDASYLPNHNDWITSIDPGKRDCIYGVVCQYRAVEGVGGRM